jgi:hypothetical protein
MTAIRKVVGMVLGLGKVVLLFREVGRVHDSEPCCGGCCDMTKGVEQ